MRFNMGVRGDRLIFGTNLKYLFQDWLNFSAPKVYTWFIQTSGTRTLFALWLWVNFKLSFMSLAVMITGCTIHYTLQHIHIQSPWRIAEFQPSASLNKNLTKLQVETVTSWRLHSPNALLKKKKKSVFSVYKTYCLCEGIAVLLLVSLKEFLLKQRDVGHS